ncbi:MAG: peptidoglycan/LPS O-acetylase OafA/YrhL [Oleiphilaceae bacterium]
MNREDLDFDVKQAIGSSLFLWLLIFIWGEVPPHGIGWGMCLLLIGFLMVSCTLVIVTGFTSVQYKSTRQFLSFAMGGVAIFIASLMFRLRWNEWYDYLLALIVLVIVTGTFFALLENKKFQRCFEALLITLVGVNMLRIVTVL